MKKIWQFLFILLICPFFAELIHVGIMIFLNMSEMDPDLVILLAILPLCQVLSYLLIHKKINHTLASKIYACALIFYLSFFTVLLYLDRGKMYTDKMRVFFSFLWLIPYPFTVWAAVYTRNVFVFLILMASLLVSWALAVWFSDKKKPAKKLIAFSLAVFTLVGLDLYLYVQSPNVKYAGHGFPYMHGYSSTDFSDYFVYAKNSKLASLDHEASLIIENPDDMPVLDGAEACYPLYAAVAKAVYKDIDILEESASNDSNQDQSNGRYVSFTNSVVGFERLYKDQVGDYPPFNHRVDLFFGARPSKQQLKDAKDYGVELIVTPIGKEAFVFFVEATNPVDNLTADQLRDIYHGSITNWKKLGGDNKKIIPFQRPKNSGSQTVMEEFMDNVSLKEPITYEESQSMGGVIERVASYHHEEGAIGYSFKYFVENLAHAEGIKLLDINGISPHDEHTINGTYPLMTDLCVISTLTSQVL